MRTTVVIVTYNSSEHIGACLSALAAATTETYDLVVLDNASRDSTVEILTGLGVEVHRQAENLGFARGCNVAVQLSRPREFVLLLNPDARLAPGALDVLTGAADRHPDGAVFGARVLGLDGRIDPSCAMGRMTLWSTVAFGTGLSTVFAQNRLFDPESLGRWQRDDERPVPVVPGTVALIRRRAWDAVRGFDERFVMYSEDVDLCARLARRGWACWLVPSATAVHATGGSSDPGRRMTMLLRGRASYADAHFRRPLAALARRLLLLGVFLRARGPGSLRRLRALQGRRPRTAADTWEQAWRDRRTWLVGWPARGGPDV